MPEACGDAIQSKQDTIIVQTNKIPNVEHETEWATIAKCDNVASDAETNLTAGTVVATFPTGATCVRAIVVASVHVLNLAANTHHIAFKVQGNGGGLTQICLICLLRLSWGL